MILNGNFFSNTNVLELKYFEENKGEITILFDEANYNITGWTVSDLNGNITKFKISDIFRNIDLDKKTFVGDFSTEGAKKILNYVEQYRYTQRVLIVSILYYIQTKQATLKNDNLIDSHLLIY